MFLGGFALNIKVRITLEIVIAALIGYGASMFPILRFSLFEEYPIIITLSGMLPIIAISFRWGVLPGIITGLIQGCLVYYNINELSLSTPLLLEYLLGFSLVGFAGLFKKYGFIRVRDLISGTLIGGALRLAALVTGGILYLGPQAKNFSSELLYILKANALYIIADTILCLILILILRGLTRNKLFLYQR